jgi:hypothetical protein
MAIPVAVIAKNGQQEEGQDICIGPARLLEGHCLQPAIAKSPPVIWEPMQNEAASHITIGSRLDMTGEIFILSMKAQDDPKEKKMESTASWIPASRTSMDKGFTDGTTEPLGDSSQFFDLLFIICFLGRQLGRHRFNFHSWT